MAEYIERDKVLEKAQLACVIALIDDDPEQCDVDFSDDFAVTVADIVEMPAADVVEVVRCRDCKWLDRTIEAEGYWLCNQRLVREDDFCSYGRRKENNND